MTNVPEWIAEGKALGSKSDPELRGTVSKLEDEGQRPYVYLVLDGPVLTGCEVGFNLEHVLDDFAPIP